MKQRLTGLLAIVLASAPAFAVELVKDINAVPVPTASYFWGDTGADVAAGTLFVLEEHIHGAELWIGNGTFNGTRLLRDINPGSASSRIAGLTVVSGVAYFFADDGVNGRELWRSDGTAAGTQIVVNIGTGAAHGPSETQLSDPIASANGLLYFPASDGTHGVELWRSDGTAAGTLRLSDSMAGTADGNPGDLRSVGARMFFLATDAAGRELWVSDGASAGTHRVADIAAGAGSADINQMTAAGGALFFSATDSSHGAELWRASGDGSGASMIADLNTAGASNAIDINAFADGVIFIATTGAQTQLLRATASGSTVAVLATLPAGAGLRHVTVLPGGALFAVATPSNNDATEVWITDGTAANTRVLGLNNLNFADYQHIVAYGSNEAFFFARNNGNPNIDLWRTDGTAIGTRQYAALNAPGPLFTPLVLSGGRLYFVLGTSGQGAGTELWSSDGTPGGTGMVRDIFPGSESGSPSYLRRVANRVMFSAHAPGMADRPWVSDGTLAGTVPMDNLGLETATGSSTPRPLGMVGNVMYLGANDGIHGDELWLTDGTEAGTRMVGDFVPGELGLNPQRVHSLGNGIALFMNGSGTLWRTDGTESGTYAVHAFNDFTSLNDERNAFLNGVAYFTVRGSYGDEVWRSDGSAAGTYNIVPPGGYPSNSLQVFQAVAGNRVMFSAHLTTHLDLWWTDGTSAGTVKASDTLDVYPAFWSTIFQGRACLQARSSGTAISEIWCSNGAPNSFERITNLESFGTNATFRPVVVNGSLIIDGVGPGLEGGLFATDGTPASTRQISSFRMNVDVPTIVGNRAVYNASNGELWVTDGTAAGTRNFFAGVTSVQAGNVSAIGSFADRLVFTRDETSQRSSVWQSDGTAAGTKLLADVDPGVDASPGARGFFTLGSRLYFTARRDNVGYELWSLNATDPNATSDSATVNHNSAAVVSVLANDTDLDSVLTPSSVQVVSAPASGTTVVDQITGAITYTPNNGFSGTDRLTYRVADPQGHLSNVATVSLIVKPAVAASTADPVPTPAPTPTPTPTPTPSPTPPVSNPPAGGGGGGGGALGAELWMLLLASWFVVKSRHGRGNANTEAES